jgi:hypothetical protein
LIEQLLGIGMVDKTPKVANRHICLATTEGNKFCFGVWRNLQVALENMSEVSEMFDEVSSDKWDFEIIELRMPPCSWSSFALDRGGMPQEDIVELRFFTDQELHTLRTICKLAITSLRTEASSSDRKFRSEAENLMSKSQMMINKIDDILKEGRRGKNN